MKHRLVIPLLVVALAAAACSVDRSPRDGTASPDSGTTTGAPTSPATALPSGEPSTTEPPATEPPTVAPADTPAPTEVPTPAPTDAPSPGASGSPSAAADSCTGNADNLDFLAHTARDMDWTVLCAVLPKGWTVKDGSYTLAKGGQMVMNYKNRAGATLSLSEGAFCQAADGCVPAGSDAGDAALGPMAGTLVALDDGGFAIVVGRGDKISWLMEAHGMDEATARSLGAALAVVEG